MTREKYIRLFVSSTFNDMRLERDILQSTVFPEIKEFCNSHGWEFEAVDLRWGISSESGLDQKTMHICLSELKRCQRVSPKPNFLVLMGDRYGWIPLPESLPASLYGKLYHYASVRQAGLLEEDVCDPYYERLQREYLYLARKFDLRRMEAASWRLLRTRPGNFPHVRIAQMAWLFYREHALLSRLMEAADFDEVRRILTARTSDYWDTHYTFGAPSPRRHKTLSRSTQDLLVINTLCPFLFAYGTYKADERLTRRAFDFLERLKPESNAIIRRWQACGLTVENATDSQALIQLKKEYCDAKKCLRCRFGYEFLKAKEPLQTSPEGRL